MSSDYGGVHEYADDGKEVLLSQPRDVEGLVKNICYLIENAEKRFQLAYAGYEKINRNFSRESSVEKMLKILN